MFHFVFDFNDMENFDNFHNNFTTMNFPDLNLVEKSIKSITYKISINNNED